MLLQRVQAAALRTQRVRLRCVLQTEIDQVAGLLQLQRIGLLAGFGGDDAGEVVDQLARVGRIVAVQRTQRVADGLLPFRAHGRRRDQVRQRLARFGQVLCGRGRDGLCRIHAGQLGLAQLQALRIREQPHGQRQVGLGFVDAIGADGVADGDVVFQFQLGVFQQGAVRIDGADLGQRFHRVVRLVLEDRAGIDALRELRIERIEQFVLLRFDRAALGVQRRRVKLQLIAQLEHVLRAGVVVAVLRGIPVTVDAA